MAYTVKIRTLPGSPMQCEYECPEHDRFELLVERDANGDPPPTAGCGLAAETRKLIQTGLIGPEDDDFEDLLAVARCSAECALVVSAPNIKFWSRDPVALQKASKSDEKDPRMLDTEPLATGKMTRAEWKKYQHGITLERRHQKLLKAGKRSKRIQVGGG